MGSTTLQTGITNIPVTAITGYTSNLAILLNQAILGNSNTTVQIDLQVSYDGATTWLSGGSSGHNGHNTQMGAIFGYSATPTHFQGTITVGSGPIQLSGSISVQ